MTAGISHGLANVSATPATPTYLGVEVWLPLPEVEAISNTSSARGTLRSCNVTSNVLKVLHKRVHRRARVPAHNFCTTGQPPSIGQRRFDTRQQLLRYLTIRLLVFLQILISNPRDHGSTVLERPVGPFKMQQNPQLEAGYRYRLTYVESISGSLIFARARSKLSWPSRSNTQKIVS
jgi:hypothetical protein